MQPTTAKSAPLSVVRDTGPEKLIRDVYDWLYFVARDWRHNDAEDIVQDALVRALESWDRVGTWPRAEQRAWVKKVALRTVIDARRKSDTAWKNRERAALRNAPDALPDPLDVAEEPAVLRQRERLLACLSPSERTLLRVWSEQYSRDLTVKQAADRLSMTEDEYAAARRRLSRALHRHAAALHLAPEDIFLALEPVSDGCALNGSHEHEND